MKNSPPRFIKSESSISIEELARQAQGWFLAGEIDQHSPRTLERRRDVVAKLLWFLRSRERHECGLQELRHFLAYLTNGHKEPGGRWGNPLMTRPVRPRTVHTVHGHLRTLFRWLVMEGALEDSPMERIPVPTVRHDQVEPFSQVQVNNLLFAAKRARHARRDEAILLFMLDTGLRASEVCSLKLCDVDIGGRRATVLGKGN